MAFTYGFYNYDTSDSGDSKFYDAQQMSQLFDGIITDGVYAHVGHKLAVTTEKAGKAVKVESGRAWFNHTWNYNDSNFVLDLLGYPSSNRIDAVVIDINSSRNSRTNRIKWVRGDEAANPQRPNLINDDQEGHYQHALAYVKRRQGRATITQADITNVIGTTETPYVTGILQQVDADQILSGFEAAFDEFRNNKTTEFNEFLDYEDHIFQSHLSDKDATFDLQLEEYPRQFTSFINSERTLFNNFIITNQEEFNALKSSCEEDFSDFIGAKIVEFQDFMVSSETEFSRLMSSLRTECEQLIGQYALKAEGYAVGKQNGSDVSTTSPYYHNNAEYHAAQAKISATSAASSSGSAANNAVSALNSANTATSKASEASNSASTATTKANEAISAAQTANTKASAAASSASSALNSASTATTKAAEAASSAQTATVKASEAATSAERAEIAASHPPYIGPNGNWFIWDANVGGFVDSGIDASITVDIADITMLPYGEDPSVTNTGTNTDPVFHLSIPNAKSAYLSAKDGGYTGTEEQFNSYLVNLQSYATSALNSANTATSKASAASTSATNAANSAKLAESYTKGGTGTRTGENTDNSLHYKNLAKTYAENAEAVVGIGIATTSRAGIAKPDGETIFIDEGGKITAGISDNDWATLTQLFQ